MSFDRLAPVYRPLEFLLAGDVLQRSRTAFLEQVVDSRRALVLGEGPGRFLPELLRVSSDVRVTCVERSPQMIAQARRRLPVQHASRVEFVCQDARHWTPPNGAFDLIVTQFFLDCFAPEQVSELVRTLSGAGTAEVRWIITEFQQPASGWRRVRARLVLALMYAVFRRVTDISARCLTEPDPFLSQHGFRLIGRRTGNFGLVRSDLWARSSPETGRGGGPGCMVGA